MEKALKMCTYNGYHQTFDEKERGSLEAGKVADMVILSKNPFAIKAEELNTVEVEQLLLGGRPYRPLTENPIKQVVRGLFRK